MAVKWLYALVLMGTLGGVAVALTQTSADEFVVTSAEKKKVSQLTRPRLKERLVELLEDLAHYFTRMIQQLAQSQEQLLYRIREIADDSEGCFSKATHKRMQELVHELEAMKKRCAQIERELSSMTHVLEHGEPCILQEKKQ